MTNNFFQKHKSPLFHSYYLFFLNLFIISILLLIASATSFLNIDLVLSSDWLSAITIISITATITLKYNLNQLENKNNSIIEEIFTISPYFFLSLLVILTINQFLKYTFITDNNAKIIVLAIAFGFLTFYKNKNQVEQELEEEKRTEEQAEQQRKLEFSHKFPRINKIWGLRSIVKWMYKEGPVYISLLLSICVLGLILRIWNIDYLQGTDNFNILAAKALYQNGAFAYNRGIHLTYLISFLFHIFGAKLWVARMPFILIGTISIFFIYFLGRLFSKKVGLMTSFLLAISPVAIEKSSFVREYADIFLWVIIILLMFFSIFFKEKDKKKFTKKLLISASIISVVLYILSIITNTVTLRSALAISIFTPPILLFYKFYLENKRRTLVFASLILFISSTIFFFFIPKAITFFDTRFHYQPYWFNMFFNPFVPTPMQWYSFSSLGVLFILSLFIVSFFIKGEVNKIMHVVFWLILLIFIFKVPEVYGYVHSRYLYFLYPLFITLMAVSLYSFILSSIIYKNKILAGAIIILFILSNLLIVSNTLHAARHDLSIWKDSPPDKRQPTASGNRNYFYDIFHILEANNLSNKSSLVIQGENQFFISWYFDYSINRTYNTSALDFYDAGEKVYVIDPYINFSELDYALNKYEEGFVIGHSSDYPKKTYIYKNITLEYLGSVEEYKIYRWSRNSSALIK